MTAIRVVVGSDEAAPLVDEILVHLRERGFEVIEGPLGASWPIVGRSVAEMLASGGAERGIACCWTGTGVCMAANKVAGARAALCTDAETAAGARRWNDANVLALSLRLTSAPLVREIVDAFMSTEVDPHDAVLVATLEDGETR